MTFSIKSSLRGSVTAMLKDYEGEAAKAVTDAVRTATQLLKSNWRGQITGAGLSSRLANTVRSKVYPQIGNSLSAAGIVYTAPGSAEKLLAELEDGAIIESKKGRFLAIPTENVPKGTRGTKQSPTTFQANSGIKLRFARAKDGTYLLVGNAVSAKSGHGFRPATRGRVRQGRGLQTVVFYILVSQVTMRKRLDLMAAAEVAQDQIGALIAERLG